MKVKKERVQTIGQKITITTYDTGLIKTAPKRQKKKIQMNPLTKKLIQEFNSIAGMKTVESLNKKAKEMYRKVPG